MNLAIPSVFVEPGNDCVDGDLRSLGRWVIPWGMAVRLFSPYDSIFEVNECVGGHSKVSRRRGEGES